MHKSRGEGLMELLTRILRREACHDISSCQHECCTDCQSIQLQMCYIIVLCGIYVPGRAVNPIR